MVDAGGLAAASTLKATGQMSVGQGDSTDGYNYAGILDVGAHAVTLMDADEADLSVALLAGGSLGSSSRTHLDPAVGYGGYITGEGTLYGDFVVGVKDGANGLGIVGTGAGIDIAGTVSGNWRNLSGFNVVGQGRILGGFSPGNNPLGPGNAGALEFGIGGVVGGSVEKQVDGEWESSNGDYTQYFVHGDIEGHAGTRVESVTLKLDQEWNEEKGMELFEWADLKPGDKLVLIQAHEWSMLKLGSASVEEDVARGRIIYADGFETKLQGVLDTITLADGVWIDPIVTGNELSLLVVPEPGTLVLLATGGLGLLTRFGRRRLRR